MERTCEICGKKFDARYEAPDGFSFKIYRDNTIIIKSRVTSGLSVEHHDCCDDCVKAVSFFINFTLPNRRKKD